VRNDEFVIEVRRRGGRIYYTYRKAGGRWQQDVANGKTHDVTAEQVLNHLLPVLAGTKPQTELVVRHEP
jgi:hypothetical protein